ncbi:MAG: Fic family protein [Desulfobacula sp.]|jgi:Fic family protein|uniref:Fic family protein n=1 Tax=Desulfobacula sp. TaxID=2593537 RepID=UPI001E011979|nr:Fic family protein [Desulfobacula sp.]MBT3424197.1 Fic family protein [Bacteroidota bacterium]MBT3807455.1 Fic family protein [Desulfobacula sp.]MBT4027589.1 Fic family protein [Desulfobacula sp.]MBT4201309.1 Fic family protein [Desulfobacula sp.]
MNRDLQGRYITISTVGEKAQAFIPATLPPTPPIEWSSELREKFDQALLALGRLDSVSVLLPDTSLFLYMYVRKEAVLSSMIEGTQSSLSDLLLFEFKHQPGVPLDDVQEVSNYVAALHHGLKRLGEDFPLSLRLLKEIHSVLLSKGRGKDCDPGEFRRSQNWIGGSRPGNAAFVPPPPEYVQECMGNLELFLHDQPNKTPALIKAALAHVQFETIHPFLDGNGRLGRLIITLLLCSEKLLKKPMLYLSLYFKTHRQRYYELLNQVRLTGDWETWLDFFADAVIHTATRAVETSQQLMRLSFEDGLRINGLKRISGSAHLIHKAMLERPIGSPNSIQEKTQLSPATVNACLRELEKLGIVKEITGQKRNRLYSYVEYIQIMNEGTELPQ